MGDEWFAGYAGRSETWPELAALCPDVEELVVANASGGWGWSAVRGWWPWQREMIGLVRSKDVMYNSSTRIRRRDLVARFRAAERSGQGTNGALVHIPQSPFETADAFRQGHDDQALRAQEVVDALGDTTEARSRWESMASANAHVGTTLGQLGPEVTVRLLYHAYVLAMCNLHVVLGYPLLALPGQADFAAMVQASSA